MGRGDLLNLTYALMFESLREPGAQYARNKKVTILRKTRLRGIAKSIHDC